MTIEAALKRWLDGEFSDEEVSAFTGLTPRALRDLSKWGAIETSGGERGRGKRRIWRREAVCKAAITAAIHRSGQPLSLSSKIAFAAFNVSCLGTDDPMLLADEWGGLHDPPQRFQRSNSTHVVSAWLSDDFAAAKHDAEFDTLLHIMDGRFVFNEAALTPYRLHLHEMNPKMSAFVEEHIMRHHFGASTEELRSLVLGSISEDGLSFEAWNAPNVRAPLENEVSEWATRALDDGLKLEKIAEASLSREWEAEKRGYKSAALEMYEYRDPMDEELAAARGTFPRWTTRTTVNTTLAMRLAMRRAMNLPAHESMKT